MAGTQPSLYSEEPLNWIEDRLERSPFVEHLEHAFASIQQERESSVFALVGPWGSGKSAVLRALSDRLENNWRVLQFSPWSFEDSELLIESFFTELADIVPTTKRQRWKRRVARPLGKLGEGLRGSVKPGGVDAGAIAAYASSLLNGKKSAIEQKKSLDTQLGQMDKPLLVVMDDIDRLRPNELLSVFRLVRLLGRLKNVYYVLSYDEDTLTDLLQTTDVAGKDPKRAALYLQKIVQVRFDLPPLEPLLRDRLFRERLHTSLQTKGLDLTEEQSDRLEFLYQSFIAPRLLTARAVTQLVTQFHASLTPALMSWVDPADTLALAYIRLHEPLLFRKLPDYRDELLEWLPDPGAEEGRIDVLRSAPDNREKWRSRLELECEVQQVNKALVLDLLGQLFPGIAQSNTLVVDGVQGRHEVDWRVGPTLEADAVRRHGLGDFHSFGRYFTASTNPY